jgi:predicted metal-dependent phosphoesterase TrpH
VSEQQTAPAFDLQSHSTHSDGALRPSEVVARARAAGVELLALTDHDTVAGVAEALAAADGITVIGAIELSAVHGTYEDLHILGYGVDHTDPAFLAALEGYRADRVRRIHAMADNLRALGFEISALDHPAPGRPHLAQQLPMSADEAFTRYLVPGTPTYVGRERPTVREAIDVIHAAGGLAVWAHPYWDVGSARKPLEEFTAQGLDGVEAFYVTHTEAQTRELYAAALELGLITTGSTDFHGPEHPRFNRFRGFELYGLSPHLGALRG